MKENKKTTKQHTAEASSCQCQSVVTHENRIIERSALVTSLLINLFFLVGWVTIMASHDYARVLGSIIYNL